MYMSCANHIKEEHFIKCTVKYNFCVESILAVRMYHKLCIEQ